jgi:hypothetical protein
VVPPVGSLKDGKYLNQFTRLDNIMLVSKRLENKGNFLEIF